MADTSIVEVRTYYIKPGQRDDFVRLFQNRARPLQERYGIKVLGPLVDLEDSDVLVWLRSFPSLQERDHLKDAFYGSPDWTQDLEAVAMPMIDHWDVRVAEAAEGAFDGSLQH